jgi:ligand-binding sensor domain-containing protein
MAGGQSIAGASVQIYAAGTTGNGSAATALLTTALTTDANGAFTVPAAYPCPATTSQLYVVARGGQAGTTSPANQAIALATPLGTCSQLPASSQFVINEVTTAATVWGLAQFFSAGANLGSSATNTQGIANAVATVANLVNTATGSSPGAAFPANGVAPTARINTLANLLNTCTAATTPTPCEQLFASATPAGASAPNNTFDAALNVVRNPGNNVSALYTQAAANSAFTPALTSAPSDWTLFITYIGGGMNEPTGVSVDSMGNAWVANYNGVLSEFTAAGAPVFPNGITGYSLNDSYGLAIDASNNVWVINEPDSSAGGSVSVFNSSGQPVSGSTGYTAGGIDYPTAIAMDTNTNVWVVDNGDASVTLLSSTGAPLSGASGYQPGSNFPTAIAVDANHNAWIGDQNDAYVIQVSSAGKQLQKLACCDGPSALAVDQSGNVWAGNYYSDSVTELSSAGTILLNGAAGGGLKHPIAIAIDGAGTVWVANFRGPSLSQLGSATSQTPGAILSPAVGWASEAALLEPYGIAVDASGDLWVSSFATNSLVEYIGMGVPVKTPLIGPPQLP